MVISAHELHQNLRAAIGDGSTAATGEYSNITDVDTNGGWLPPEHYWTIAQSADGMPRILIDGPATYLFALLWLMCAVSGTSVPIPRTTLETAYTTCVVLLGFLLMAYVIGTFTAALSQLSAASNVEQQKRDYIDQFLWRKRVPQALRRQVSQFCTPCAVSSIGFPSHTGLGFFALGQETR